MKCAPKQRSFPNQFTIEDVTMKISLFASIRIENRTWLFSTEQMPNEIGAKNPIKLINFISKNLFLYHHLFGKICLVRGRYAVSKHTLTLSSTKTHCFQFCFMPCFTSSSLFSRCICHWHPMRAHTIKCMCDENNWRYVSVKISLALALPSIFVWSTCVVQVSLDIPTQVTAYSFAHAIDISLFSKRQVNTWILADGVLSVFW